MLTVMTEDFGLISACAYGVRSKKSRLKAGVQLLSFSDFVLNKKNGDIYRVDSASVVDGFYPICEDLTCLSLANYICDAASEVFSDGDRRVLRLVLNTFYALAYRGIDPILAKAVFELKLMQYSGYEPSMDACIRCGTSEELCGFDFSGGMVCSECVGTGILNIPKGVYKAVKFILLSDDKKIFSFSVSQEVKNILSVLAEGYFLGKSEKNYKSLDYFKKIL